MKRAHRTWHFRIWLILSSVLVIGLFFALRIRPHPALYTTAHDAAAAGRSEAPSGDPPGTAAP
jgi:hypothetical protein